MPVALPVTHRTRFWLLMLGIGTIIGLFNFGTYQTGYEMDMERVPVVKTLVNELTGAYTILPLLPLVLWFIGRVPLGRTSWPWAVPLHLAATLVFGASHTLLMTVSRVWLYRWLTLGNYWLGDPVFRFLMEYHKQFLVYWCIVAVVYAIGHYQDIRRREQRAAVLELQAAELRSELAQAQLQALRGQLQPHFLFNTLNLISSCMYEDVKTADRLIGRLAALLRMSLESSGRPLVPLREEVDFLKIYAEIMEARFEDRLSLEWDIDPALLGARVPPLILQPLVENAIRHNDFETSEVAWIRIAARREGGALVLEICDNGPGLDPARPPASGVGLANIGQRLRQLFGDDQELRLANRPAGGLAVTLRLPLRESPPGGPPEVARGGTPA